MKLESQWNPPIPLSRNWSCSYNSTTGVENVEIPSAEGRGIRKSSRVVMRAGVKAEGRNVSPNDHEGGFSIPLAEGRWDFHSHL